MKEINKFNLLNYKIYDFSIIIGVFICFISCTKKSDQDVMSVNNFKNTLIDIYLTEAFISQNKYSNKDSIIDIDFYYQEVYKNHQTDRGKLNETYIYYAKSPKILEEIYDDVLDSLNKLQINLKPVFKKDTTKTTSLNKNANKNQKNPLQNKKK